MAPAGGPFSDPTHTYPGRGPTSVARKQSTTCPLVLSPLPILIGRRYTLHSSTTRTQSSARMPHNRPSPTGCHIVLVYKRNTASSRRLNISGGAVAAEMRDSSGSFRHRIRPDKARGRRGTYTHNKSLACLVRTTTVSSVYLASTSMLRRYVAQIGVDCRPLTQFQSLSTSNVSTTCAISSDPISTHPLALHPLCASTSTQEGEFTQSSSCTSRSLISVTREFASGSAPTTIPVRRSLCMVIDPFGEAVRRVAATLEQQTMPVCSFPDYTTDIYIDVRGPLAYITY
jgi:hypothetical protein